MNHRTTRKLARAAALSLLVLTTASGMAGVQALVASPAIADQAAEETPAPAPAPTAPEPEKNPVTDLLGGVIGGGA